MVATPWLGGPGLYEAVEDEQNVDVGMVDLMNEVMGVDGMVWSTAKLPVDPSQCSVNNIDPMG